jgi:hypothetical protein
MSMEDYPLEIQEIAAQQCQFVHEFSMIYMEVQ